MPNPRLAAGCSYCDRRLVRQIRLQIRDLLVRNGRYRHGHVLSFLHIVLRLATDGEVQERARHHLVAIELEAAERVDLELATEFEIAIADRIVVAFVVIDDWPCPGIASRYRD